MFSGRKFDPFPLEIDAAVRVEQTAADLAEVDARHGEVAKTENNNKIMTK